MTFYVLSVGVSCESPRMYFQNPIRTAACGEKMRLLGLLFGLCCCGSAAALQPAGRPPLQARLLPSMQRTSAAPVAVQRLTTSNVLSARVRRWLYNALEPLDKGDFRWEFLVPFNNKTLTSLDKFIVCSTFIGLSFTVQTVFDPGASVGVHLSYIAQFFSYAMGDPIGFRLLAVLTAVLEIGGNLFETKAEGFFVNGANFNLVNACANVNEEDVFPIFYDQLFIVINRTTSCGGCLRRRARVGVGLGGERGPLQELLRAARIPACAVLAAAPLGGFVLAEDATALTVQGEPLYDLYVPINGTIEVRVGGAVATTLPPYQLVGEARCWRTCSRRTARCPPRARRSWRRRAATTCGGRRGPSTRCSRRRTATLATRSSS